MSRISKKFDTLKSDDKTCLISYITAGDPSISDSLDIMKTLVNSGTDIIELGVPFSDPMADGPTIQRACERALSKNTSCKDIFQLVENFRKNDVDTPIVLMGYLNPIERMGYELFAQLASQSGVDAILIVDLPHEEAEDVISVFKKYNLSADSKSMKIIGYKHVLEHLLNATPIDDLKNKCLFATRQLAKRQITWLKQFPSNLDIDIINKDYDIIYKMIERHCNLIK